MKIACLAVLMCAVTMAQPSAPDPCKLLTPADIVASFGPGFRQVGTRGGCNFVRRLDTVMIGLQRSTMGPANKAIPIQRDATAGAKPISGACDAGFSRPSGSLLAGKGIWLVTIETDIGHKPDVAGSAKLASLLCSRL